MQISITQFFDQIFIINLIERRDRRHEMELQVKKIGIYLPNDKFFPAIRPKVLAGFPSIGARGCFLSHLSVLSEAAEKGLQAHSYF
jgi:GR25 family glycosyltransferase involved in LPS biosynthesis